MLGFVLSQGFDILCAQSTDSYTSLNSLLTRLIRNSIAMWKSVCNETTFLCILHITSEVTFVFVQLHTFQNFREPAQ